MSSLPETWRRTAWAGDGLLPRTLRTLSLPLEGLYRLGVAIRNRAFDYGVLPTRTAPVPVVSVGNLSVGGTGKTPLTSWIVRELVALGARPAVVSRGYGHDEIMLHERWNPAIAPVVAPRRNEGVCRAADGGATIAVLDDGFQHRWTRRQLDIVLIAAEQPFPAPMLPRGPFREPAASLRRAHVAVVTRKTATEETARSVGDRIGARFPELTVLHVELAPSGWTDLAGRAMPAPEGPTLAVASVAAPETFTGLVERLLGSEPSLVQYPDHHAYSAQDAESIRGKAGDRALVTTEKDAVKLVAYSDRLRDVRVLTLSVEEGDGTRTLRSALGGVVGGEEST